MVAMPRTERSERLAEAIRRRVAQGIVGAISATTGACGACSTSA